LARECEIQLSYTIGLARPVGIQVETYDTEQIPESEIAARLSRTFDFRLASIMRQFGLRELPRTHGGVYYRRLAVFGQVGREDLDLPWEQLDMVDALGA
jgi:S-adenosylmethionine synthetase